MKGNRSIHYHLHLTPDPAFLETHRAHAEVGSVISGAVEKDWIEKVVSLECVLVAATLAQPFHLRPKPRLPRLRGFQVVRMRGYGPK
jgi:hypothetical protein